MRTSRMKKEHFIILPNKDKLPVGKIKDVNKFLNMVGSEYGIDDDMTYFAIEKEKSVNVFKLQYIPRVASEIRSVNAKKFMIYELIKNGHGCVMKIDDELNKRALAINDLLNTIDDKSKDAVTSKLQSVFDIPGELDYLLDQMLNNPQYNSFKYTVLDSSKTSCLLCVNSEGLVVRALEPPYNVIREVSWLDIVAIKTKANNLILRKKDGETDQISCINKKMALTAHCHLTKYLRFMSDIKASKVAPKSGKGSWFGSFALRIRQSFSRRQRPANDSEPQTSAYSAPNKSISGGHHYSENAPPNSTVPGSSVVSEDCMDNIGSMMDQPSIKTNSTHDVSLGSASSFRPGTSAVVRMSGPEDHVSVKTTSTYEVNLDTVSSNRGILVANGGGGNRGGDQDQIQARKNPPLSQLKDSLVSKTSAGSSVDGCVDTSCYIGTEAVSPTIAEGREMPPGTDSTPLQLGPCVEEGDKAVEADAGTRIMEAADGQTQHTDGHSIKDTGPGTPSGRDRDASSDTEILIETTLPVAESPVKDAPVPRKKSIPSPKILSHVSPSIVTHPSPSRDTSATSVTAPSPSDKENHIDPSITRNGATHIYPEDSDDTQIPNKDVNFSRFDNEEYVLDSKTTITSVSSTRDSITKKSTKTEISSVRSSGIPAPKQYKTTTTITSTVKKSSDGSKSPVVGGTSPKSSGIPRMSPTNNP